MSEEYNPAGMKVRREVLGDEYVDRAIGNVTDFTRDFQHLVSDFCWGGVWTREGLSRRERSITNLGLLAGLGRFEELKLHVRGALNNGMTPDEIKEVLLQAAVYCGIPAGIEAFRAASEVIKDYEQG
mgnify:CR=1 FL=1